MKEEFTYPSRDQKTQIHALRWSPEGKPKGVVQLVHGMRGYAGQYEEFARFLADRGYCVTGCDLLGHGSSVVSEEMHGYFAKEKGVECLITDIRNLFIMTAEKYPDAPYFLFGQRFGAMLLQEYLMMFGEELNGVILCGSGIFPKAFLRSGKRNALIAGKLKGWDFRSQKLHDLVYGPLESAFPESPFGWMTKNPDAISLLDKNPWNHFRLTVNAYREMFRCAEFTQNPMYLRKIVKGLPIFLIGGKSDPFGGNGDGVRTIYLQYLQNHLRDVTIRLYEGDRNELLFEDDRDAVSEDILTWLDVRASRGR